MIRAVREAYDGPLVYAANYDEYEHVPFWGALDLIGVDAYWPLADRPTTDARRLRDAWRPVIRELAGYSARHHRRVLFTEAGYVSQRGATTAPYSWTVSRQPGRPNRRPPTRRCSPPWTGSAGGLGCAGGCGTTGRTAGRPRPGSRTARTANPRRRYCAAGGADERDNSD